MIAGVNTPAALLLPYIALIAAFGLGYIAIVRGIIIEPPAFITKAVAAMMERLLQRTSGLLAS